MKLTPALPVYWLIRCHVTGYGVQHVPPVLCSRWPSLDCRACPPHVRRSLLICGKLKLALQLRLGKLKHALQLRPGKLKLALQALEHQEGQVVGATCLPDELRDMLVDGIHQMLRITIQIRYLDRDRQFRR